MVWTATERYNVEVAPGGLALVQELLNTFAAGKPRRADLLADVDSAQGWLDGALAGWGAAVDRAADPIEVDDPGREKLLDLRARLHDFVGGAHEVAAGAPYFDSAAAKLVVGADGVVRAEPVGSGWRRLTSLVLIEALDAQRADRWRRLKTCRNTRCGVTFFDRSKNNSGAWHDVRVCGNAANVRAHRARLRAGTADS